jgi:hypothetical protein
VDPLVGLRPVEVIVELGDYEYTIPPLPAADWIAAVLTTDGGSIVPGLLNATDQRDVWTAFVLGEIDGDELAEVERAALEVAAGRPWWEADRLIRNLAAQENWPTLHGELMLKGLDLAVLPLAAALNAIYALIRRLISHDEPALARFDANLAMIPAGVDPAELPATDEDEFRAMMLEQQQMG